MKLAVAVDPGKEGSVRIMISIMKSNFQTVIVYVTNTYPGPVLCACPCLTSSVFNDGFESSPSSPSADSFNTTSSCLSAVTPTHKTQHRQINILNRNIETFTEHRPSQLEMFSK